MIPIALLEKFDCYTFISRVEVLYMIADSSKPNKLRKMYTPYEARRGTSPSTNGKFTIKFTLRPGSTVDRQLSHARTVTYPSRIDPGQVSPRIKQVTKTIII